MAKKVLSLVLALLLCVSALPVMAQDAARAQTISQLNDLVKQFLDGMEYDYTFEDDVFYLDFNLDSSLGSAEVKVFTYYDMVSVVVVPPIKAKAQYRDLMAKYLTLANYECFYSQFRMDYRDGEFSSRSYVLVESVLPGIEELGVLFHMPLSDIENFGDGMAQVALMGVDPQTAFDEAMAAIRAK